MKKCRALLLFIYLFLLQSVLIDVPYFYKCPMKHYIKIWDTTGNFSKLTLSNEIQSGFRFAWLTVYQGRTLEKTRELTDIIISGF